MKSPFLLCSMVLALASGAAQAQSFNVDIGSSNTTIPSNAYGAAAAQPGVWTRVSSDLPAVSQQLKDLVTGNNSAVALVPSGGAGNFTVNNFLTTLDDERLLDDAQDVGLGSVTWTFSGLQSGNYEVYTYAWAPDSAAIRSNVSVLNGAESAQLVGGTWSGTHALGLTYAKHTLAVTNLARHETRPEYPKIARVLPLGTLLIGFVLLKQVTESLLRDQSPALWVVGIVLCAFNTSELMRIPPPPLPPRIGSYIRILPVLQASLCLLPSIPTGLHKTPDSFLSAIALLACVPLHAWLGKKFYAS